MCLRRYLVIIALTVPIINSSCLLTKPLDRALSDAIEDINDQGDLDSLSNRIAFQITRGATEGLLHDSTQVKLQQRLAEIMEILSDSLVYTTAEIRDSLLSDYTALWIDQRLISITHTLRGNVKNIRDELLGMETKRLLGELRTDLLGDSTALLAANLRDELLGPRNRGTA